MDTPTHIHEHCFSLKRVIPHFLCAFALFYLLTYVAWHLSLPVDVPSRLSCAGQVSSARTSHRSLNCSHGREHLPTVLARSHICCILCVWWFFFFLTHVASLCLLIRKLIHLRLK
uniref:Uncharacterized protein n=1 Tax=Neovison vison TaxID=452646 RepID=A0A8C7AAQ4_NEOVI